MLIEETVDFKKTEGHVSQDTIAVCKVSISNRIIDKVSIDITVVGRVSTDNSC